MKHTTRIWEIDFARGIALILMIIFHVIYDLQYFFDIEIQNFNSFWYNIGRMSAILFILISGISSTFSKNTVKRGIKIIFYGFLITIITYIINNKLYIRFGILHLLGLGMIISNFFIRKRGWVSFFTGSIIIILENIFKYIQINTNYLFPIGIINTNFSSWDYYPIVPWLGLYLYGITIGKVFYNKKRGLFAFYHHDPIAYMGRNSLVIYLLHQPIILLLLYVIL